MKMKNKFTKGQIVWAKKDFLASYETQLDTIGIVLDYNEDNDYLKLGTLTHEKSAFPPIFNARGDIQKDS